MPCHAIRSIGGKTKHRPTRQWYSRRHQAWKYWARSCCANALHRSPRATRLTQEEVVNQSSAVRQRQHSQPTIQARRSIPPPEDIKTATCDCGHGHFLPGGRWVSGEAVNELCPRVCVRPDTPPTAEIKEDTCGYVHGLSSRTDDGFHTRPSDVGYCPPEMGIIFP